MASYSSITIVGNVCANPELKQAGSGNNYTSFSIAVNSGFGDKKQTSFFNCVFFGKQAETISRFVQKGSCLLVEGTPVIESYSDKDGNKRQAFKITGRNFAFIGSKETAQEGNQQSETASYTREDFKRDQANAVKPAQSTKEQIESFFGAEGNNNDLPF